MLFVMDLDLENLKDDSVVPNQKRLLLTPIAPRTVKESDPMVTPEGRRLRRKTPGAPRRMKSSGTITKTLVSMSQKATLRQASDLLIKFLETLY